MNTKDWLAFYNTTAYPRLWSDSPIVPSGQVTPLSQLHMKKLICVIESHNGNFYDLFMGQGEQ